MEPRIAATIIHWFNDSHVSGMLCVTCFDHNLCNSLLDARTFLNIHIKHNEGGKVESTEANKSTPKIMSEISLFYDNSQKSQMEQVCCSFFSL